MSTMTAPRMMAVIPAQVITITTPMTVAAVIQTLLLLLNSVVLAKVHVSYCIIKLLANSIVLSLIHI